MRQFPNDSRYQLRVLFIWHSLSSVAAANKYISRSTTPIVDSIPIYRSSANYFDFRENIDSTFINTDNAWQTETQSEIKKQCFHGQANCWISYEFSWAEKKVVSCRVASRRVAIKNVINQPIASHRIASICLRARITFRLIDIYTFIIQTCARNSPRFLSCQFQPRNIFHKTNKQKT